MLWAGQYRDLRVRQNILILQSMICLENPVCYEEGYRIEVLVILQRLERLDQDVYLEDERQEAEEVSGENFSNFFLNQK